MILKSRNGFTMIEILIVTIIIGLVAALAVPDFTEAMQKIRWHGAASDISSALRLARSTAISQQTQYGVTVDTSSNKVIVFKDIANKSNFAYDFGDSLVREDSISASTEWLWASFTTGSVCFFPNGRASESGWIMASSYTDGMYQMFSVSVLAATGKVAIDYIEN